MWLIDFMKWIDLSIKIDLSWTLESNSASRSFLDYAYQYYLYFFVCQILYLSIYTRDIMFIVILIETELTLKKIYILNAVIKLIKEDSQNEFSS